MCHLVLLGLPLAGLSVFWFLPLPVALPAYLLIGAATAAFYRYLYKGNVRPIQTGAEQMQLAVGEVLGTNGRLADVRVRSELWSARYDGELCAGDRVRVVGMDGLLLRVRKVVREQSNNALAD